MTDDSKESAISLAQLERLLSKVDQNTVLVGGQALAFWVDRYGVSLPPDVFAEGISKDADFLGNRNLVRKIAVGVHGTASYPPRRAITALVGQVTIPLADNEYLNVDIIDRVVGVGGVEERAIEAQLGNVKFLVMHPLDMLKSRIENLAQIPDKRTTEGADQAKLSLAVARAFVEVIILESDGQHLALKAIEQIVRIGKSGAGRLASREFGVDFLPAIPAHLIESESFQAQRWPRIIEELSWTQN